MFKKDEYVVYRKKVCKIKEIKENKENGSLYYILIPVNDQSLKIEVPTEDRLGVLRKIATKEEIENLIKKIPSIDTINENDRLIENEYKALLHSGKYEDLIKIIKTTYSRNKTREDNNKKASDKDISYFRLAEEYLYTEFSLTLNMSYEDTKNYIENAVRKIENNE